MPNANETKTARNARKPRANKPAPKTAQASAPVASDAKPATLTGAARHIKAGVNAAHVNAERKTAVPVGVAKYAVTPAQLRPRALDLLASLRKAYGGKPFPVRALDNALIARLINAGLIAREPKTGLDYTDAKHGVAYIGDKPDAPLQCRIASDHGKA